MATPERFVPYDQSVQWAIQDAYYQARGIRAWSDGDIPYLATSNYAMAAQHAALLARVVHDLTRKKALAPHARAVVLEVGSGNGRFAANFLRALAASREPAARALRARLLYVLSDFQPGTLRDAAARPPLRPFVEAGRVVPALFDLRTPGRLRDAAGRALELTCTAVIANYVCSTTPIKALRKEQNRFLERYVAVSLNGEDAVTLARRVRQDGRARSADRPLQQHLSVAEQWRPVALRDALVKPIHASTLAACVEACPTATVTYPLVFLDALHTLARRTIRGGVFLVTDFGSVLPETLNGTKAVAPAVYGNSLAHPVQFAVLEAFARRAGWDVAGSGVEAHAVHTLCIRTARDAPRAFRRAFAATQVKRSGGHDLLDWWWAAHEARRGRDFPRTARFLRRCLRLDPRNPELLYYLGEACVEIGSIAEAERWLERGRRLDESGELDFDFQLARVHHRQGRRSDSIAGYQRSLAREPHPVTFANLGVLHLECGRPAAAFQLLRQALELDPHNARAQRALDRLDALP